MADTVFASFGDLMETDLSVQVLNAIFGSGWHNLAAQSGTAGTSPAVLGELLFSLFGVLNCCCALVAAWLFILTTLSATLGAAQDGHGIAGRRYSNAWIPVRYSFALGAVTPVFGGLNAMQMLMLSCIGLSVQFADAMWTEGLEELSKTGTVLAKSQPVTAVSAGRVLPVLMEHHVLKKYFRDQERCAFADGDSREYEGWSKNRYRISLELPRLLHCPNLRGDDGYGMTLNPALHFGDMGGMHVSTPVRGASEALARALAPGGALYRATEESVSRALASDGTNLYEACDLGGLARLYQETVSSSLKDSVQAAMNDRQGRLADYVQNAASQGWWMAGSYYWTLAKLAADSVEAMQDRTEAVPVNVEALADFMNPDLERALGVARELGIRAGQLAASGQGGNPAAGTLSLDSAEQASMQEEGGLGGRLGSFFSGASHAISEFALDEKAIGTGIVQVIAGHDLVFNVVRASRVIMNVCENAVAAYVGLSVASRGLGALVRNPVTAAVSETAVQALDWAGKIALCLAAPLWLICWFYAYMLPMLPFLAWVAAILGWLVLCLEALAACPVWLVAHCMPEGDGFAGASARAGYALFLSVLLRPALLVLSFFLCMVMLSVSGSCMGALLVPFFDSQEAAFAAGGFGTSGWGVTASISTVVLTGLVTGLFTWKVFTLITVMPDRIIRWAGQLIASLGDMGAEQAMQHGRHSMETAAGRIVPMAAAGSAVGLLAGRGYGRRSGAQGHQGPPGADALERQLAMGQRRAGSGEM